MFDDLNLLERHCKLSGKCNKIYNNIYKFDETKLGKYIFETSNSGECYIVRNNCDDDAVKIGITENLYKRIGQYRCGMINEPALLCYFPCKDILLADPIIKKNLLKFILFVL